MSDEGSQSSRKSSKKPKYSRFSQQELPAYKPILTPGWVRLIVYLDQSPFKLKLFSLKCFIQCLLVDYHSLSWLQVIASFILVGVVFIPVGLASLSAADQVEEILERYDDKCSPFTDEKETLEYIESNTTNKTCTRSLTVRKKMKNPIFIYYQLDNFYQNHRRYVKSRNVKQLRIPTEAGYQKDCDPIASSENPIIPCGLIAWSLFNDTYRFSVKDKVLEVDKKDIAWRSDKEYKFGSQVYPKKFQSGGIMSIGGGKLDESLPLSEQEDLIVWMRTAALPTFRKLYGKITVDLEANDNITVVIENNYNTYKYGGQKVLVLSTTSWMGGKNHILGRAYLTIGGLSLVIAICFIIMYLVRPRPLGDPAYLSWNRYPAGL